MFNTKKSLRSFVVMSVLFVLVILNGVFTLGSVKNSPVSAWNSEIQAAGDSYFADYVSLNVSTKDADGNDLVKVEEGSYNYKVWLNVGRIYQTNTNSDSAVIVLRWKSSEDFSSPISSKKKEVTIKKGINVSSEEYQYVWYCVNVSTTSSSDKYFAIETKDVLQVNEVVITNAEGTVLSTTVAGRGTRPTSSSVETKFTSASELEKNDDAFNLIDEQYRFQEYSSMTRKYNFTEAEVSIVNAVLSLNNGDGLYVTDKAGALGLELVSLGMSVFGVNTLGVRIVPYLFFMLTLALVYAFANKVFSNSDAGLVCSVLFVLAGLPLSVGSIGSVKIIGAFFALLSLYLVMDYPVLAAKCGFDKKIRKFVLPKKSVMLPLITSALAFGFAFTVDNTALFILPVNLLVVIYGLIQANKVYKKNAMMLEFEDEKLKNKSIYNSNFYGGIAVSVLGTLIVTVWFTLMFYSFAGTSYSLYYKTTSLLTAIFKAIGDCLFDGISASVFGWIIGMGSMEIYPSTEGSAIYLGVNTAFSIISLVSFIVLTIILAKRYSAKKSLEGMKDVAGKYLTFAVGYLFTWISYVFVGNADITSSVMSLIFSIMIVCLLLSVINETGKTVKFSNGKEMPLACVVAIAILALAVLFFLLGYVMFAGIEVSKTAAAILFGWWRY